jgi:hypothetical protein
MLVYHGLSNMINLIVIGYTLPLERVAKRSRVLNIWIGTSQRQTFVLPTAYGPRFKMHR